MALVLGLHISPHSIRGTLARAGFRKADIVQYLEVPLAAPGSDSSEGTTSEDPGFRQAIQDILIMLGKPPDRVVTALSGSEVSVHSVSVPLSSRAASKINEVLPFELEGVVPFELEDAVVDYQTLASDTERTQVLAAAAAKPSVRSHLARLQHAGITTREIGVAPVALQHLAELMPEMMSPDPVLLVHIGKNESDLCVLKDGRCHFARALPGGLDGFVQLAGSIRHSLVGFRASGGAKVDRVICMGEGGEQPDFVARLQLELDLPVEPLHLPPAEKTEVEASPRFSLSTALACTALGTEKRIDLRRGDFAPRRSADLVRRYGRTVGWSIAAVLVCAFFATYTRWSVLSTENHQLEAKLRDATGDVFGLSVGSVADARRLFLGEGLARDPMPQTDALRVLELISDSVLDEITHNTRQLKVELRENGDIAEFELRGSVDSVSDRDQIVERLRKHRCVTQVETGRATPGPGNQGLNYQIEGQYKCKDSLAMGLDPTSAGGDQ